jgi:hypothetical protein
LVDSRPTHSARAKKVKAMTSHRTPKFLRSATAFCALLVAIVSAPAGAAEPTAEERRVDRAIKDALRFLAREQGASGAWRIEQYGESTAATSLAVMSFLAAGHMPGEGPYGKQIERGIRWVIDHQEANGMIVHAKSHGPMYSHGISTLMLAEVVGMVDESLAGPVRKALERGVALILQAQNVPKDDRHAGGWRYNPQSQDSDLSVTGWQLLALRAAKDVGCDVPADNIDRAVAYVNNCEVRQGGFAYQPGSGPTPTRTGTGILALEVCGKHHSPAALRAADFLLERPLQPREHYFYYGVYYCSVGMFKVGGRYWDETKRHLNDVLLSTQLGNGSWSAERGGERGAGTVYATSMSVLALAVEYRYLPIYQR